MDKARRFAQELIHLGCRFALDDFGAGFGSFYYLKHLPISYLKIDGEFVKDLPRTPADRLVVKAVVDICQGLGIKTVAEFVGDEETVELLTELGVDFAQGYHVGRPHPVAELRAPTS
jgi:EAL domain-containing protein (putative c-di-GMP-specific phosphodiesterase class I)